MFRTVISDSILRYKSSIWPTSPEVAEIMSLNPPKNMLLRLDAARLESEWKDTGQP